MLFAGFFADPVRLHLMQYLRESISGARQRQVVLGNQYNLVLRATDHARLVVSVQSVFGCVALG
jgi:hypothetical protein